MDNAETNGIARDGETLRAADTIGSQMAALYDAGSAQFPEGAAVYLDSQVWTVGMEVQGLAQITRNGRMRYVATSRLSPVTVEDEFRGAAFAYLRDRTNASSGGAR